MSLLTILGIVALVATIWALALIVTLGICRMAGLSDQDIERTRR
jgi:hypothetical protein